MLYSRFYILVRNFKISKHYTEKLIHSSSIICNQQNKLENRKRDIPKAITSPFEYIKTKEKETFLECIRKYEQRPGRKADVIAFIKIALKYMDEFGVNKDVEVYKQLLNLFPKGPLIPKNLIQSIFFHCVNEQFCAVEVLSKMEENGVCPDEEMELILLNTFGKWALPVMKCHRLAYWFPKFTNSSPWIVPNPLPTDTLELAKEIIGRITSVDLENVVTVYQSDDIEDSIEKTWIVSAMSPNQKELLKKHEITKPLFVEGPFRTWLGNKNLEYFILKAKPPTNGYVLPDIDSDDVSNIRIPHIEPHFGYITPYPTVHEQEDGIIMSVCATGTSTKDSLLSWIRSLQKENSVLKKVPIVFTLKKTTEEIMYIKESDQFVKISSDVHGNR